MDRLVVSLDFLEFPPTHTCDGGNLSPRLTLRGLNASSVAGSNKHELITAMKGHAIQFGETTAICSR